MSLGGDDYVMKACCAELAKNKFCRPKKPAGIVNQNNQLHGHMNTRNKGYEALRDFAVANFRKYSDAIGVKLETIQDDRVRNFFEGKELARTWVEEMGVTVELPIATGVNGMPLGYIVDNYTKTEFGELMFEGNYFNFGVCGSGGPWIVSLDDGKVFLMAPSWSSEYTFEDSIVAKWDSLGDFVSDLKTEAHLDQIYG